MNRKSEPEDLAGLKARLESLMLERGADLFGVADLAPAMDFIIGQGGSTLESLPMGVSIGIRLSDPIVDNHSVDEPHAESQYWHHVYSVVTPELEDLARRVQGELQAQGYAAFPIPGSMPYNRKELKGVFSHKLAAHLAGLGWIGKSCLLINPDYGPRVRFSTVLTDAPLEPDSPLDKQCGKCRVCITTCPIEAFTGKEFDPGEPVSARFDTLACEKYRREHPCGICVSTCPIGRA